MKTQLAKYIPLEKDKKYTLAKIENNEGKRVEK